MRKSKGKLTGILGTVIIHLIAGIIFHVTCSSVHYRKSYQSNMKLNLPLKQKLRPKKGKDWLKSPATTVEKVLKGDEEMLNIARNLASKPAEKINATDYIEK